MILDLSMPTMGGEETYRRLKQIAPDAPVVLMSGYSEPEAMHQFVATEPACFLQNPFQPDELREDLNCAIASTDSSR